MHLFRLPTLRCSLLRSEDHRSYASLGLGCICRCGRVSCEQWRKLGDVDVMVARDVVEIMEVSSFAQV
jgi:hypothetical protein